MFALNRSGFSILREEGEADVFTVRQWSSDSSDEEEEYDSDYYFDFRESFGFVVGSQPFYDR